MVIDTKSKMSMTALTVVTLIMAPSLFNINSAAAATHWCGQQGKSNNWVNGCKVG